MDWRLQNDEHPDYGNRYNVINAKTNQSVTVWAWNRKNARLKGSAQLNTKPQNVAVSKPLHLTTESPTDEA